MQWFINKALFVSKPSAINPDFFVLTKLEQLFWREHYVFLI